MRRLLFALLLVACDSGPKAVEVAETSCARCHVDAYEASAFGHAAVKYGDACAECHTEADWTPTNDPGHARFWPLVGAHAAERCRDCHGASLEAAPSGACVACHADDRARAVPSHERYPEACEACHTPAAWKPAEFDHGVFYPLIGRHQTVECGACHVNDVYAGTPRECVGCHADDRARATPPHDHFPTACEGCHGQTAWKPAALDHDVFFRLRGAHRTVECASCHANEVYAGTPRECVGCHADDRARAVPPHGGFPTACGACHTESAWRPASFDHDAVFPLMGRHATVECASCHVNDVYAGTPRACVGCHADDRARATPPHAGFPADCAECHGQTAWRPADFDHDEFPVPHEGVRACGDCHLNPNDYKQFSCTHCHEHRRSEADDEHLGEVRGYVWESAACYRCHPRGRE